MTAAANERLPLPTLLSFALVAFTIECDNESEHLGAHRTTRHGATAGSAPAPWLTSIAMWLNCMQFLDEKGLSVRDLERRARTRTNLRGMQRWRYVKVAPDPADPRPKPPPSAWVVRPTVAGAKAQQVWRPLLGIVEERWKERFGKNEVEGLKTSLQTVTDQIDLDLPDGLPILGYGFFPCDETYAKRSVDAVRDENLPLLTLLSRVLLVFAIDFEHESSLALAMSANVLRVLDDAGLQALELPRLTGISKEAVATSLSFLTKRGFAVVEADPAGSRGKVVRLTAKGLKAQAEYQRKLRAVEENWLGRFGKRTIVDLRKRLESMVGDGTAAGSALFRGLEPYPEGWRASVRSPETLPHYPTVLHRGGYPDGS